MTDYYWKNCYRWSQSSWDKYNALPEDTKRSLTEGGGKQDWLLKYEKELGRLPPWLTQPPKSLQIDCKTGEPIKPINFDADGVGNSYSSDLLNETPCPWEKWAQLPKEEREAEIKEATKEYYQAEDLRQQIINRGGDPDGPCLPPEYREILSGASEEGEIDVLTGETADIDTEGNSDEKHVPPFTFWDVTEQITETEAVGGHFFDTAEPEAVGHPRGLFPLPDFSDQSANVDEQQNTQVDAVTGYSLNNDDVAGCDWFQMHRDDEIMDSCLDTVETANRDMIITEFPEFPLEQAITFEESGMDGLVAAGPFDAVALNGPQTNNVF